MVRLNRIYTRTGDSGTTALVGGERVDKDHARIEAYGTVDELNACIGLVRQRCSEGEAQTSAARQRVDGILAEVQQRLFDLGASLATRAQHRRQGRPAVGDAEVGRLEQLIDTLNDDLPELRSFVLPGGGPIGATLHLARTVCRRAERRTFTLGTLEAIDEVELRYLNRRSDMLFVLGRGVAAQAGESEVLWLPGGTP